MDDQTDNKLPQPHRNGDMPLLAASAAARMVRDIVGRLSGPHAGPGPGVLRPGSLWRQVARRVGAARPQPETTLPLQSSHTRGSLETVQPDFVWRTRRRHIAHDETEVEATDWGGQDTLSFSTHPAASVTGPQLPVPPLPAPPPTPEAAFEGARTPSIEPAISAIHEAHNVAQAGPPVFIPPKVVQIEYVPGPPVVPPTPLAAPRIHLPQPSSGLQGTVSRTLGTELNQEFVVPTSDLLARMTYAYEVELNPPAPRLEPALSPEPEHMPAVAQQAPPIETEAVLPASAQQALPTESHERGVEAARDIQAVPAPPLVEPPALEMPLATPPPARKTREAQPASGYIVPVAEEKGLRARLFDRIVAALPILEPLRREEKPVAEPAPPASSQAASPQDTRPQPVPTSSAALPSPPGAIGAQAPHVPTPAQFSATPVQPTPTEDSGAPTPRPAQSTEASGPTPGTIAETPAQGTVGTFIGRLFGGAGSASQEGTGPAPVSMPWARRGRKQPDSEPAGQPPEIVAQSHRPQPAPSQPVAQIQPIPAAGQVALSPQPAEARLEVPPQQGDALRQADTTNVPSIIATAAQTASQQPPDEATLAPITEVPAPVMQAPTPQVQTVEPEPILAEPTLVEAAHVAAVEFETETPGETHAAHEMATLGPDAATIETPGISQPASYPSVESFPTAQPEAPTSAQPYMGTEKASQGFLGGLVSRMLRTSPAPSPERPAAGPTPLDMPQARRSSARSAPDDQTDALGDLGEQSTATDVPSSLSTNVSFTATPAAPSVAESAPSTTPAAVAVQPSLNAAQVTPQVQGHAEIPPEGQVQSPIEQAYVGESQAQSLVEQSRTQEGRTQETPTQEGQAQGPAPTVVQTALTSSAATGANDDEPQPYMGANRGSQGLLGAIVSRLLGGETTSQGRASGPAPLPMPWVHPVRRLTASQDAEFEDEGEATEPRSTQQPERITVAVPPPSETSQVEYQAIEQPSIPAEVATQPASDSVVSAAVLPEQPAYDQSQVIEQTPQPSLPQEAQVAEPAQIVQPTEASQEVPTSTHEQSIQYAEQTWNALAEMADDVMRSHEPLVAVEPVGGAIRKSFLNRIFRRQGRALKSPQDVVGGSAQPASTEGGSQPGDNRMWTPTLTGMPTLMNRPARLRAGEGASNISATGGSASLPPIGVGAPLVGPKPLGQTSALGSAAAASQAPTTGGALRIHYIPPMVAEDDGRWTMDDSSSLPSIVHPSPAYDPSSIVHRPSSSATDQELPEEGEAQVPDYLRLLQQYYGHEPERDAGGNPDRPLAHPYGAFATPSDWHSSSTGEAGDYDAEFPTWSAPSYQPEPSSVGMITSLNWNAVGQESSAGNGSDGSAVGAEAGSWANVVSSALGGYSGGNPALALAGEERPSAPQQPMEHAELHDGSSPQQNLEELADSVYGIIRRRLEIERERNW